MIVKKIGIIGAGNMGEALIKGLAVAGVSGIFVSDISKERLKFLKKYYKITVLDSNKELVKQSKVIILAVKPQNIDSVLSEIALSMDEKNLIISIAAGIKTSYIEKRLKAKIAVVRAMPNMPALVGKGISAICTGRFTKTSHKKTAFEVLSRIGRVVEVSEDLMDAVTAISGSGPAYFFFLMEALIRAGIKQGLNAEVAKELAIQTALGAASLVRETRQDPHILRQKVTSKGGTTEAAFGVFQEACLDKILQKGIEAAIERSKELSCS